MRHLIYILVILLLSFAVNAQLKNRSLVLEDKQKQTFKKDSNNADVKIVSGISPAAIELNEQGYRKVMQENDHAGALKLFQKAVETDAECHICRYNLGRTYLETNRLDEALEELIYLTRTRPEYADAFAALGDVYGYKNRLAEGIQAFRRALKLENFDPVSHCNIAILLHRAGNYEEAVDHFDTAIKQKPDFAEAFANRGVTRFTVGEIKQALKDFQKADSIQPDTAEVISNIGVVLDKMGKKKQAFEYYLRAVELRPEYPPGIYNLALSYLGRGDREAAMKQLKILEEFDIELADKLRKQLWQKYVLDASDVRAYN